MKWFLAKVVFRIICGEGLHTAQFDEQLRILNADNEQSAFRKACEIGCREEQQFLNVKQQLVQWKFMNVTELFRINDFTDGAEIYSRIYETDDGDAYTQLIEANAKAIQGFEPAKTLQYI